MSAFMKRNHGYTISEALMAMVIGAAVTVAGYALLAIYHKPQVEQPEPLPTGFHQYVNSNSVVETHVQIITADGHRFALVTSHYGVAICEVTKASRVPSATKSVHLEVP